MEPLRRRAQEDQVPRFFFHVFDDAVVRDEEGMELADAEAARRAALAGARALICDQVKSGRLTLHHRVEVEDEQGRPVLILPYRNAVAINP
jgi:uncharacterized protein DUF6894